MNKSRVSIYNLPHHAAYVLRRLEEEGYLAYLVGGCVRDTVMGRPVHDWDVATSASPEDVARVFPKTFMTGARFGTVTVLVEGTGDASGQWSVVSGQWSGDGGYEKTVEVTSFRADGEYSDGRRPDSVRLDVTLEEDLSRRDFTMNAMALSSGGAFTDPFGGLGDIEKRIIRCVGEPQARFREDGLRMFRAFRFSAELDFAIEPETLDAIYTSADRAELISGERVRVELEKTLMSERPQIAGDMIKAGLLGGFGIRNSEFGIRNGKLSVISSQWSVVSGQETQELKAPKGERREEGTGDAECTEEKEDCCFVSLLSRIADLPGEPALRWCAFCSVLLDSGFIQSCSAFLRGLRLDRKTIKCCSQGIKVADELAKIGWTEAMEFRIPNSEFRIQVRQHIKRLLAKNGVDAVRCAACTSDQWTGARVQDTRGTSSSTEFSALSSQLSRLSIVDEIVNSGECFSLKGLSISGHDLIALGHEPGSSLKDTLNRLLGHVIDHPEDNVRETLIQKLQNPSG